MQIAHSIKITAFCKENDSEEETKVSLLTLLPFTDEEIEKEKIVISEEEASLEYNKSLRIFSIELTKNKYINPVLEHIFSLINEDQKQVLIDTIDTRLDDSGNFYFRLDKSKFDLGECEVVDHGNCYHFRINIAAYPAKKEVAKKIILELINNTTNE